MSQPPSTSRHPGRATLAELSGTDDFARRHIGPDHDEQAQMLAALGVASLDDLLAAAVPPSIRMDGPLALPEGRTEVDVLAELRALAGRNRVLTSLIGMGYYGTVTPPVILRNLLENPAWYTAYTPYQPEISQGRLEALLNFQTMVSDLTGMDLANASMLDEATAAAEAMAMAHRLSKSGSDVFLVDADTHPQTVAVLRTRAEPVGIEVVVGDLDERRPAARLRRPALLPGLVRAGAGLAPARRAGAGERRPRRRGDGPAGAGPARGARCLGRRHRRRVVAALRRAARLRWPPRRVPGHARRLRPRPPRALGRRQHRHQGPAGPAPGPADA